jgi:hypothetical protein
MTSDDKKPGVAFWTTVVAVTVEIDDRPECGSRRHV